MASVLGERLQGLLDEKGLSARRLALTIGTSPSNISHYCNGENLSGAADILVKCAKTLGVSTDYLLGLTDDKSPADEEIKELDNFSKEFGHLTRDEDFLMIAGVYNALTPKARNFLAEYVRSYGIYQSVLSEDGVTVKPISFSPKK